MTRKTRSDVAQATSASVREPQTQTIRHELTLKAHVWRTI